LTYSTTAQAVCRVNAAPMGNCPCFWGWGSGCFCPVSVNRLTSRLTGPEPPGAGQRYFPLFSNPIKIGWVCSVCCGHAGRVGVCVGGEAHGAGAAEQPAARMCCAKDQRGERDLLWLESVKLSEWPKELVIQRFNGASEEASASRKGAGKRNWPSALLRGHPLCGALPPGRSLDLAVVFFRKSQVEHLSTVALALCGARDSSPATDKLA